MTSRQSAGLALSLCLLASRAGAADPSAAAFPRGAEQVRLDGALDEPAWALAAPVGAIVQSDPQEGAPASEETEVRVLFDADTLYVGVLCRDRSPREIVATQLARDADLEVDDRIVIVIDPFLDHRNGFFFEVNAAGARADGQIANNVEERDRNWDGIWDARARVTPEGWSAELAIPFKTLRFKPRQSVWGFNVERQIKRRQETDRWAGARRDVWISNLAEAGELSGLEGIRQGRGLDLRPYASGGEANGSAEGKLGLDVTKALASNLTGVLTLNTDFAETEADERQVNLTRFPLFLPEKRAFFLEGAGVYEVAGLGSHDGDLIPFFSRRIGISEAEDREVPILAGAKISGRLGDTNVGVLDVETGAVEELGLARQNLLAARVSRNLFRQSWVGVIATHGDPEGRGGNDLIGADVRLATSEFNGGQNLSLDLYAFHTRDANAGSDQAFGFKLDYPNDRWDCSLKYKQIGDDFLPALGFLPRAGIRKTDAGVAFQPRPERFGIRQLVFEAEPALVTSLDGTVQDWNVLVTFLKAQADSGDSLEASWDPTFQRLDEAFEVQPGIVIPPGSYRWDRWQTTLSTATKRPWVVELGYGWGGFYDGSLRQAQVKLTLKPSAHLNLALAADRGKGALPGGNFVTRIYTGRLDYNASPNVAWSNLVQYDSESRILGVQSRLRWTLRPGNDLFVVFNRGWLRSEDGRYSRSFDRASAKLQYTFRL